MTNNICPDGREHRLTVSPSSVISRYHGFHTLREAGRYNLPLPPVTTCLLFLRCCWCLITKSHLTPQPHGLQHIRLACPSLSPRVCSKSCPLSQWCHPIISSSVVPFSSCPQFFPASGSFPTSQLFISCGQSRWEVNLVIKSTDAKPRLLRFKS